jgi:hypothetical protein
MSKVPEGPCRQCSRPNDIGVAKCWHCEVESPTEVATMIGYKVSIGYVPLMPGDVTTFIATLTCTEQ